MRARSRWKTGWTTVGIIFVIIAGVGAYRVITFRSLMGHANELYLQGRYAEAADEYQQANGVFGSSGYSRLYCGEALMFLKRPAEAKDEMTRAAELEPDDAHCHVRLAAALIKNRDYATAEKAVRQALRIDAREGEGHFVLAKLLPARKDYDGARQELTQARNCGPHPDHVAHAMDQFEQAISGRAGQRP